MFRLNVYEIYRLAVAIHPLASIEADTSFEDYLFPVLDAQAAAFEILASSAFSFRTTKTYVERLLSTLEKTLEKGAVFSAAMQSDIRSSVQAFEAALADELAIQDIYSVTKKGIYSTSELIDSGDNMVSEGLRPYLPTQAKNDLQQAGRCLAFELSTGAGFHLLRAAEAVIKKYYEVLAGKPREETQKNDWGEYTKELGRLNAPKKLIDSLDQVRFNYRNPLMHPEDNLDFDEALALFGAIQGLISLTLREMKAQNAKPSKKK